jgi:hypothetical protein
MTKPALAVEISTPFYQIAGVAAAAFVREPVVSDD